jgi:hypothetical protein
VKDSMNKYVKIGLMLTALVAVALVSALLATRIEPWSPSVNPLQPRPRPSGEIRGDIQLFYTIKTVVSSVNVTLLVFLLVTYVLMYEKTQSEFTVGLVIFSLVLLFYALSSNPLVYLAFGFSAFGLGPFAMLPDLFTSIALGVLLYLTFK